MTIQRVSESESDWENGERASNREERKSLPVHLQSGYYEWIIMIIYYYYYCHGLYYDYYYHHVECFLLTE